MSVITLLILSDLEQLKVMSLSLDLEQDKARLWIYYTTRKVVAFDITAWLWQTGGVWRFGWSIEKLNDIRTTVQLDEKLKSEIQKLLLPYFRTVR